MAQDQVNLGSVFIDLRINTANIARDTAAAKVNVEKSLNGVAAAAGTANKAGSAMSGTFSQIGKGLLGGFGIGAGLIGIQAAVSAVVGTLSTMITSAAEFEQKMANINTVLQANKPGLKQFADGIKEIAKNSPSSVDDLGAAAYDIVSAGITDTAQALKVLNASQRLATAGLGTNKEAVDIMTSAINAYGIKADQAAAVSNIFYNAVNYGKATVSDLAQGFGGMVPIVAQAGITFEEVGAAVGALTSTGKSASEVYTGLEAAASALLKPNADMIKVFDKLGAQTGLDLVKKFGGLKGAYEQIVKTSKELGLTTAEVTGRKEAQSTVTALLTTAEAAYEEQLKNNLAGVNNIDAAYQTQLETTQNVYKMYKNQLSVILITLGEKILPLLVKSLGFVIDQIYNLYQYGRVFANGFTFVAKGIAAVAAALTGGVKIMFKNTIGGAIDFLNGILSGLNSLGSAVLEKMGFIEGSIPNSITIPTPKFAQGADDDLSLLLGTIDQLAIDASQDLDDVGDAVGRVGSRKALAGIEGLGEAFGRINQEVAEVDPEFERAGKSQEEAGKKAQEALRTFGDLSKALQESVQDRLKFFASETENNIRLNELLSDTKISVSELAAAWKESIGNVNKSMQDLKDNNKKVGDTIKELTELGQSYGKDTENANKGVFASYEALNAALDKTKTKMNDILSQLKQIDEQSKTNAEKYKTDVVQAIVDAEEKAKDLRKQIAEARAGDNPDSDRIAELTTQLKAEQDAIKFANKQKLADDDALAEERKKRSLNRVELVKYEYDQEQKQLADRKVTLEKELTEQLAIVESARLNEQALYASMKDGIIALEEELTAAYQANLNKRIADVTAYVNKADAEYKRLAQIVAAANALQSSRIGVAKVASPIPAVLAPTPTNSPTTNNSQSSSQNITINPTVNNPTDWAQVGTQLGWQLRGAQ